MILQLLPLIRGWHYETITKTWDTAVGEKPELGRGAWVFEGSGFVLAAACLIKGSLDGKYATVTITIDYPGYPFTLEMTPKALYDYGLIQPHNFGPYVNKFDDSAKEYAAACTPAYPIPFSFRWKIEVAPPAASIEDPSNPTMTVKVAGAWIAIHDREAYKASLRELIGPIEKEAREAPITSIMRIPAYYRPVME